MEKNLLRGITVRKSLDGDSPVVAVEGDGKLLTCRREDAVVDDISSNWDRHDRSALRMTMGL